MFVFIIDRHGKSHIVDFYNAYFAKFRTICNISVLKKDLPITLAADNTFKNLCVSCRNTYDDMYLSDLEYDKRMVRSYNQNPQDLIFYHKCEIMGPRNKYGYCFGRNWAKLNRVKNALLKRSHG